MRKSLRADTVRMCNLVQDRPGIVQPFLMPAKLKHQVRINNKSTDLKFVPEGKTLTGGVQWRIQPQRPGLAKPLIIAKQQAELTALQTGEAVEARLATAKAKAVAKKEAAKAAAQVAKAKAASAEVEKSVAEGAPAEAGMGYYYWR